MSTPVALRSVGSVRVKRGVAAAEQLLEARPERGLECGECLAELVRDHRVQLVDQAARSGDRRLQVGRLTLEQLQAGPDLGVLLDRERIDGAKLVEPPAQRCETAGARRLARRGGGRPRARHRIERRGERSGFDVVGLHVGVGLHVIRTRFGDAGVGPRQLRALDAGHLAQTGKPQGAQSGELDEELFAQRVEGQTCLESSVIGGAQPLVRRAQPLAGSGRSTLGGSQPFAIGRVRGADLVHRRSGGVLSRRGSGELCPDPFSFALERPLPLGEGGRLTVGTGDPFLVHGEGRLGRACWPSASRRSASCVATCAASRSRRVRNSAIRASHAATAAPSVGSSPSATPAVAPPAVPSRASSAARALAASVSSRSAWAWCQPLSRRFAS